MRYLMVIAFFLGCAQLKAQQEPMYTHYSFNTSAVNPAYAGSRNVLTATSLTRFQWVNFDGAPITQTLTLHSPLRNNKAGIGFNFVNDKIGPTNTSSLFGDIAVKIEMGKKAKLALGFKAGLRIRNNKLNELSLNQTLDPKFQNNAMNEVSPNIGFGAYYHHPKFNFGFGIPYLLKTDFSANFLSGSNEAFQERHLFFIAGGVIDLKKDGSLVLRPSTFLKLAKGAKPQLDVTALLYINKKFWFGPMIRTGDSFGALVGLPVTDQFSLGYSFDWSWGVNTGRYNTGGHELMLRYDFIFKNKGKVVSPSAF